MTRIDRRRLLSLLVRAAALVAVVAVLWLAPSFFNALVPQSVQKRLGLAVLWLAIVAYVAAWGFGPIAAVSAFVQARSARRRRSKVPPRAFRALAVGLATLVGIVLSELGAAAYAWYAGRMTEFRVPRDDRDPRELNLVVLGESSALGEPFDPYLSVGQIVAWQLQQVFPDREVHVEILAKPGIGLDQAIEPLHELKSRPDAILLYSGHNEFQGRFSWSRSVDHYKSDPMRSRWDPVQTLTRVSFVATLIHDNLERYRLSFAPPRKITRSLVDYPTCTPFEADGITRLFRANLGRWLRFCRRGRIVPLAISPAGNDAGWPPCRSVADPSTTPEAGEALAQAIESARELEKRDPGQAEAIYRKLLESQPGFAEIHFRLGRLLERSGKTDEADRHYVQARDLDGLPMRCPTPLLNVYREAADGNPDLILVDGPRTLRQASPSGLVGDAWIQDGQHPTFRGYVALAQALLDQLAQRKALGWPDGKPAPRINLDDCARHFEITSEVWARSARRAASFYERTATVRFDPSESLDKAARLEQAADRIEAGTPPDSTGMPGLGTVPPPKPARSQEILNTR